jgi:Flp pilus assembly protein TadG
MLVRLRLPSTAACSHKVEGRLARLRRRGVTVVESVLVLAVFLMLLFGLFEYCRFLLVLHVTNNAAREGVRYASVNTGKPVTFNYTDYTDASGKVFPSISKYTTQKMGGVDQNIEGFQVAVFVVDPNGLNQTPVVVQPQSASANPVLNPFNPNDPNAVPWNLVSFPQRMAVYIKGTYRPLLPQFLLMPSTIPINIYAMTTAEG